MDDSTRAKLIKTGWAMYRVVEEAASSHPGVRGADGVDADWLEKRRLLLADMAIHLLQTALKPGEIELDRLRDNLHAILTISDRFLPGNWACSSVCEALRG